MKLILFFLYFLIGLKVTDSKVHICNFENVVREATTVSVRTELERIAMIKKQQKKKRQEEEIRRLYTNEGYRIDNTNTNEKIQDNPSSSTKEQQIEETDQEDEENEENEMNKLRSADEPPIFVDMQNECEVHAKALDTIEYVCPFEKKPQCFKKVSLQESLDMPQASFGELSDFYLKGSILLPSERNIERIIIPPVIPENKTFYCFCNLLEHESTMRKYIRTLKGTMKVVVKQASGKIKGCHFGIKNSDIFTETLPTQEDQSKRVCEIDAYPGELVGFKFIYDNTGNVYPANCFEKVLNSGREVHLSSLLPTFVTYSNKNGIATDPLYLQLPHFVNERIEIECVSRSSIELFNNYIFRLTIHRGTSKIINRSF